MRLAARLPRGAVLACALLAHASLYSSPVRAALPATAESSTGDEKRALELFEQSVAAYRDGRFQEAVDKLLEARQAKREPVLLFNLGRAYEALGLNDEAADAYTSYLAEEPAAVDRRALEARITVLRAQANERAAATARAARAEAAPDTRPRERDRDRGSSAGSIAPWVVTATGVAALGTGVVLGVLAKNGHDDAVDEPVQQTAASKQDDARSLARGATITLVAGSVVTAVGLVWLLVRALQASGEPARAGATHRTGGLSLSRTAPGFTF
jgi:tetratricopeptide (TPR) repeat protein